MHRHMPGWDIHSFGYHGDDGGLYHRVGQMVRQSFPLFGAGDTVGCGVDYTNNGIFFTLNGRWLGYAWTGMTVLLEHEWGPTVGIDTHSPVSCNFGHDPAQPFRFELSSFLQQSRFVVEEGGVLVRDKLLTPQEHVLRLTLNDNVTKKYSRFDPEGMPTHWFDGEPLQKYQQVMAEQEFQQQQERYDHFLEQQKRQKLRQQQQPPNFSSFSCHDGDDDDEEEDHDIEEIEVQEEDEDGDEDYQTELDDDVHDYLSNL
uniref:B30.2/SPRY domain-containing protein n=1 Tax=Cyclophora tenuis TaxID=216820 RepID=A0A6U1NJH6_CYCTE|mmetsp:Transcript_10477/g.17649  ORF Transcript_10477/g.17649 Transcript_10477/m.17649 type:complete len:257 (+) Transcript_10477:2-772(+)